MMRFTALVSSFALMFALSAFATTSQSSQKTATKAESSAQTGATAKNATKTSTQHPKKPATDVLAPAENISGTIAMIGRSGKEVTLIGSNGVPYDFDLTGKTKVEAANQRIAWNELSSETHKHATIHFLPTANGNMAETVQIS